MIPQIIPQPEDLGRLKNLSLIARWVVEGFISGLHRSPYHGYSSEFMEYRQYTPGEDLRYLDWKVYGRSDRTYIRKFQSETNLEAYVLLDASRSLSYAPDGREKLAYAKGLAACLIYLFGRQGDAVGLGVFSQSVRLWRPPRSNPRHRQELFTILEEVKAEGTTAFGPVLHETAERIGRRSMVILLSDFYGDVEEIMSGLRHLRFRHHEIICFHLVDPTEEDLSFPGLVQLLDLETGTRLLVDPAPIREAYRRRFQGHVSALRRACGDALIDYQLLRTTTPFAEALAQYLHLRSQIRK